MSLYKDDPYLILGVDAEAADNDIKKAYRKLALKYHPDRQSTDSDKEAATAKFSAIANAYEILSDEHLRQEYDRSQRDTCSEISSSTTSTDGGKKKSKRKSSKSKEPTPFRYHFSDPYEVFKQDFRDQFGMEYPGAKYDWIDFDEPMMGSGSQQQVPMLPNGSEKLPTAAPSTQTKKKGIFNRFWRNKTTAKNDQSTPTNGPTVISSSSSTMVPYQAPATTALAETGGAGNSQALVSVNKRNNRPVSMDVKNEKEGSITTTKMTITRPDGTVETVTMRTGIPGKAPSKTPALANGESIKALPESTTGHKAAKRLTNGSKPTSKSIKAPKQKLLGWK